MAPLGSVEITGWYPKALVGPNGMNGLLGLNPFSAALAIDVPVRKLPKAWGSLSALSC